MSSSETARFVDLDLLPEEARPRPGRALLLAIAAAGLAAATVMLSPAWEVHLAAREDTARLEERLEGLDGELRVAQAELQLITSLRGELEVLQLGLADLEEDRRRLLGEPQQLAGTLANVLNLLPAGAAVDGISGGDGGASLLVLSGFALRPGDVLDYAAAIEGEGFDRALVTALASASPENVAVGVRFTIELTR